MPFNSVNTAQYWNAATNQPPIRSGIGEPGTAYIVSVAGSTDIDGVSDWQVDDWIVFGLDKWYRIPVGFGYSDALKALAELTPAADRVPYFTGAASAALAVYTPYARSFDAAVSATNARIILGLGAFTDQIIEDVSNAFTKVLHVNSFPTINDCIAEATDYTKILLTGGEVYYPDDGVINNLPNNICFDSDNGLPWEINFSNNTLWYPTGLINITSSVEAATEQDLSSNLVPIMRSTQASSATAVGQLVTMNATAHGFVTGDWIFVRYGSATTAGQAAYCTEYDSDEGQSLDRPVQVTRINDNQFTYIAYSGTPDATMTIFPYVYKNNQVAQVTDSSDYAANDLVYIESDATWESFTGTQTIEYAELNTVACILNSTNILLTHPTKFAYNTADNAKITKVTKKRPVFMNGRIVGNGVNPTKPYYTYSDIGILFHLCYRPLLVNMEFEQCDFMGNWARSSYYPLLINCRDLKPFEDAAGRQTGKIETEYGFCWGNATRGYVAIDCEAVGGRHGFDEACTATYKGMPFDWTLVRPVASGQWSTNIDTHGTSWDGRIISPTLYGGDGIGCRNGSMIATDIRAYGVKSVFNAYGRVVDVYASVALADGCLQDIVSFAPSTDIATPTPTSTNIRVGDVNSKNGGIIGVRFQSPASHKFINPSAGRITCDDLTSYPLYMVTGVGAEIVQPYVESIAANNFGSYVAYLGNITNGYIGNVFGRKTGSFPLVYMSDAAATGNTINNVNGVSTSGGTVTKFSVPATIVGNFTNSIGYESKVIASGAVTKNWRNVPMLLVDTEGAAATDDLDTVNGHSYGDTLNIRTYISTRDVRLTNAGNLRQPEPRTLTDTSQCQSYVNTGSYNVTAEYGRILIGSKTYDPPSIAAGATISTTVTVTGAVVGDFVKGVSFSLATTGIVLNGEISSADTATVYLTNITGGAIDLGSGSLAVEVEKRG